MEVDAKLKALGNTSPVRVQLVLQEKLAKLTSTTAFRVLVCQTPIVKTRLTGMHVNASLLSWEIAVISVSINHRYTVL